MNVITANKHETREFLLEKRATQNEYRDFIKSLCAHNDKNLATPYGKCEDVPITSENEIVATCKINNYSEVLFKSEENLKVLSKKKFVSSEKKCCASAVV